MFECMSMNHHKVQRDHMARNCKHGLTPNPSEVGRICDSASTIASADASSSSAVAYNRDKYLLLADQPLLFDKMHTPGLNINQIVDKKNYRMPG